MLSCRPPTYNTKTKLDFSFNLGPIQLSINKLKKLFFTIGQENGNKTGLVCS